MISNYVKGKSCKIKSKIIVLILMLFSMHMNANHLNIEIQDSAFLFYNTDNLLGLNISLTKSGTIVLGKPEKITSGMMMATNINDSLSIYRIAMAGSDSPDIETPFLKIPFSGEGTVDFELKVNGEYIYTSIDLPMTSLNVSYNSENSVLSLSNTFDGFYQIKWFKNENELMGENNNHSVEIGRKDTFLYYAELKHLLFINVVITSNTFKLGSINKIKGDTNFDGEIGLDDIYMVFDYLKQNGEHDFADSTHLMMADVDNDNNITLNDAILLNQYRLGDISEFPEENSPIECVEPNIKIQYLNDTITIQAIDDFQAVYLFSKNINNSSFYYPYYDHGGFVYDFDHFKDTLQYLSISSKTLDSPNLLKIPYSITKELPIFYVNALCEDTVLTILTENIDSVDSLQDEPDIINDTISKPDTSLLIQNINHANNRYLYWSINTSTEHHIFHIELSVFEKTPLEIDLFNLEGKLLENILTERIVLPGKYNYPIESLSCNKETGLKLIRLIYNGRIETIKIF